MRAPSSFPARGSAPARPATTRSTRSPGLFVDPGAEATFTELYEDLTGESGDYRSVVSAAKRHVVEHVLAAEVNRLAERLTSAAWAQPRTRDLTRRGIREALVALLSRLRGVPGVRAPG